MGRLKTFWLSPLQQGINSPKRNNQPDKTDSYPYPKNTEIADEGRNGPAANSTMIDDSMNVYPGAAFIPKLISYCGKKNCHISLIISIGLKDAIISEQFFNFVVNFSISYIISFV